MDATTKAKSVIDAKDLDALIAAVSKRGYKPIGPTVRDGAIHYDELTSIQDLPRGLGDEQSAGSYRLKQLDQDSYFGYTLSPQSWKRFLHSPAVKLFSATRGDGGFEVRSGEAEPERYAFIGVRACELRAIGAQDRVLLNPDHPDSHYGARRDGAFIVAVNCGQAGSNCFCTSMSAGPRVSEHYDLALTEVFKADNHYFVVEVGSDQGLEIISELDSSEAGSDALDAAEQAVRQAEEQVAKHLDTEGLPELLLDNLDHPRWDAVASRCLGCGNCTMVCPTCFCTAVEDVTELGTDSAERWRKWDSCFNSGFSYIHGGSVRRDLRSRYRQWMTHKLASWTRQFGESGCVGCGRCVTWCPVGIDITEEVAAIRTSAAKREASEP